MTDDTIFHLEYQSSQETSLYRFLEDDARLAHPYCTEIRTVVLYHGDTRWAPSRLHIGTATYSGENVYLSELHGDDALHGGKPLTRRCVECARPIAPRSGVEHARG